MVIGADACLVAKENVCSRLIGQLLDCWKILRHPVNHKRLVLLQCPADRSLPAATPVAAPVAAPESSARRHRHQKRQHRQAAGGVEVTASVPGKIFKVEAKVGQAVKSGDTVVVLEAMKMEIPVVAPQDGTIASINVSTGDVFESGDVLATMN